MTAVNFADTLRRKDADEFMRSCRMEAPRMALARTFARYLASIPRYAVADNRCTRHLILRGVRSRAALAPGLSDTVVDFIVPSGAQELVLIEAKASRSVYPDAARS